MLETLLRWDIIGWIVALLITIGVSALPLNEFRAAKLCFALSAVILWAKVFIWGVYTDQSIEMRSLVIFGAFGLIGLCFVESFRWIDKKQVLSIPVPPPPVIPPPAASQKQVSRKAGRPKQTDRLAEKEKSPVQNAQPSPPAGAGGFLFETEVLSSPPPKASSSQSPEPPILMLALPLDFCFYRFTIRPRGAGPYPQLLRVEFATSAGSLHITGEGDGIRILPHDTMGFGATGKIIDILTPQSFSAEKPIVLLVEGSSAVQIVDVKPTPP